jgi:dihydrofolate reductase
MRPLILKMEMSIDGFVGFDGEEPGWPLEYYDDELTAYELEVLGSAGVHAMGRGAYEDMSPHWPVSTAPFAKPMNEIPKAVFSASLEAATWAESTIHRDLDAMQELKRQDGGPILAHGGSRFAQTLTRHDLVDEFRLNVHPVTFGEGYRLFGGPLKLRLQDVRRFSSGSVAYTYARS